MTETAEILLMEEVAAMTRRPLETLRYWRMTNQGPRSFKLGRRVVYDRQDVLDWIAEQRRAASAAAER